MNSSFKWSSRTQPFGEVFSTGHMGREWIFIFPWVCDWSRGGVSHYLTCSHYVNPPSCTEATSLARCWKPVVWAVFCAAYLPHSTSPSKSTLNHMRLLPHCFWVCHFALLLLLLLFFSTPQAPTSLEFFLSAYIALTVSLSLCLPCASVLAVQSVAVHFLLSKGDEILSLWLTVILCACATTQIYSI